MKIALVDASSAILLYKANLIRALAAIYRLTLVPSVMREITVAGHRGADAFKDLQRSGVLNMIAPGAPVPEENRTALGAGERHTLRAYGNGKGDFVIIDDGKGAAACRAAQIPYVNALLCPKLLYWSGLIDRDTRGAATRIILEIGRYSEQVVHWAHTCTVDNLAFFIADPPV